MPLIEAENLRKEFIIRQSGKGVFGSLKSFFNRQKEIKVAINDISFSIDKGEKIAYLGSNGAGKSTTIKMLTGILVPTSGELRVLGRVPYVNRKKNTKVIGAVFGQRSQLLWDLPLEESFELLRYMYDVSKGDYQHRMKVFKGLFGLEEFINTPVRQLSLGQRMKGEVCAAFIHNPEIVYLDEPTIGLDVLAKDSIRSLIREMNSKYNTTVLLTSHDLDDIEQACNRVVIIDKGIIVYDGAIEKLKTLYASHKFVTIELNEYPTKIIDIPGLKFIKKDNQVLRYQTSKLDIPMYLIVSNIYEAYSVRDICIENESIEDIVRKIYKKNNDIDISKLVIQY